MNFYCYLYQILNFYNNFFLWVNKRKFLGRHCDYYDNNMTFEMDLKIQVVKGLYCGNLNDF